MSRTVLEIGQWSKKLSVSPRGKHSHCVTLPIGYLRRYGLEECASVCAVWKSDSPVLYVVPEEYFDDLLLVPLKDIGGQVTNNKENVAGRANEDNNSGEASGDRQSVWEYLSKARLPNDQVGLGKEIHILSALLTAAIEKQDANSVIKLSTSLAEVKLKAARIETVVPSKWYEAATDQFVKHVLRTARELLNKTDYSILAQALEKNAAEDGTGPTREALLARFSDSSQRSNEHETQE